MQITDEISEVINSVRAITGAGICYYDLDNFFNYNVYGVKNNIGHYCTFCEMARCLKNGRDKCTTSDKVRAVTLAKEYKKPFFFECYMGMHELVVPFFKNEHLIGVIFIGQCKIEGEDNSKAIEQNAKQAGADPVEFLKAYNSLNSVSRQNLVNASKIIQRYFDSKIENNDFTTTSEDENKSLVEKIRNYIDLNFNFDITPKSIAKQFFINPSYASRIFSNKYNTTIIAYVNSLRLKKAKFLLSTTNAPISNIAINSGFFDTNYFSRVFKKHTGKTPNKYRNDTYKSDN